MKKNVDTTTKIRGIERGHFTKKAIKWVVSFGLRVSEGQK